MPSAARVVFGNRDADWWGLTLRDVSRREDVIALDGELHAGFFVAVTPMCLTPAAVRSFSAQVETLDRTLVGAATLVSANRQSEIAWTLTVQRTGHIESRGRFTINACGLDFCFRTDQTQLGPLHRFLARSLSAWETSAD